MDASASTIRTKLNSKLGDVTELDGGVLIGRSTAFTGFPCVRFYLTAVEDDQDNMTTAENYRIYVYSVDVLMAAQINGVSKQASEEDFEDAVDAVLDKLNTEYTLDATVEEVEVSPSQVRYEEGPQGAMIYLPIQARVKTLITTT